MCVTFEKFYFLIDEINTKPFNLPKHVGKKEKIVALVHQLAEEYWFSDTSFPINYLGYYFLEKHWLKKYRAIPTITVSESTKLDLLKLGFKHVAIVHNGFDIPLNMNVRSKYNKPTLVFLGRLRKSKRP